MSISQWVFVIAVTAFTLMAAIMDLRMRRIPNWFTVPVFAAGVLFHLVTGGLAGLGTALAGFAAGFGILLVLWLIGGGGGDVKLMGALGAWLGATYTVVVFILSGFLAALFGAAVLTAAICTKGVAGVRRRYWTRATDAPPPKKGKPRSAEDRKIRRRLLPYALPVALSTWGVLIWQVLQAQN